VDGPRRVTLRVGQNGAEELIPPGQAILVRGAETLTVMTPHVPDDGSGPDSQKTWGA
jgi:hypothetical protein